MWQLASLLHFLHVFRPLLNITLELSAEELETALVTPNSALDDVHMPLLKDKLFSSKNRTEVALGKRLKNDIFPEIEKTHKRRKRALKKQHREALLLDTYVSTDGLSSGWSLRDRKHVTYNFDDYDRLISEARKITKKKQNSPEHVVKMEIGSKPEASPNGKLNGSSKASQQVSDDTHSPESNDHEESDGEEQAGSLNRSNRRRMRPQRYSAKDYVEAVSGNEADFDSDDDIVGEAVYDEKYLRSRKQVSSSSDGDEEYRWEENAEEEEEEDEENSLGTSDEDTDGPQKYKKPQMRSRRVAKLRCVGELQSGLRRSKRASRPRTDYRQYKVSDTDAETEKQTSRMHLIHFQVLVLIRSSRQQARILRIMWKMASKY